MSRDPFSKILPRRNIATGQVIPRELAPEPEPPNAGEPRKLRARKAALAQEARRAGVRRAPSRSEDYKAFVRTHPCCCCQQGDDVEAHHWGGELHGKGLKPSDFRTVPLCAKCHERWHRIGCVVPFSRHSGPTFAAAREASERLFLEAQANLLVAWAEAL